MGKTNNFKIFGSKKVKGPQQDIQKPTFISNAQSKDWERQIILKSLGAIKLKGLNRISKNLTIYIFTLTITRVNKTNIVSGPVSLQKIPVMYAFFFTPVLNV
jgi:hypothetical protein